MKRRTFITGVLASTIMIVAYILEKTMLPGGPLLMFAGAFIGIFGFGIMLIFDRFAYARSKTERLKSVLGFLGTGLTLAGIAFHFTAWPFGPFLLVIGGITFLSYFLMDSIHAKNNSLSV